MKSMINNTLHHGSITCLFRRRRSKISLTEQHGGSNATLTQPIHRLMSQFYPNVCIPDYNSLGRRVTGEVFPQEISPVKVISIGEIGSLAEGRDMS